MCAVEAYPAYLQAEPYSAEITRRSIYGLVQRNSSNGIGTVAGGVYSSTDLLLSAPGSGLSVNVAAGECLVPGTASFGSTTSGYYLRNTASLNLPIATANPTNPRIDLVCATINDAAYHGAINSGVIQVITGTPTTGATLSNLNGAPSLPDASLLLGYVLVPTSAANITSGDLAQAQVRIAPSTALNFLAGGNGSNIGLTTNTAVPVFATSSLAVGTWLITTTVLLKTPNNGGVGGNVEFWIAVGTATAAFIPGTTPAMAFGNDVSGTGEGMYGVEVTVSMTFFATITAVGTLQLMGLNTGGGSDAIALSNTFTENKGPATMWTALKID